MMEANTSSFSAQGAMHKGAGFRAVVMGGSAGGVDALLTILGQLDEGFPLPLLIAMHLHKTDGGRLAEHLERRSVLPVAEANDKEIPLPGHIYLAPADYHLLVERDGTLALSVDPKVNWARPSIDVLFESAARCWGEALVAVILSGANHDGADGMRSVGLHNGLRIAQNPGTAAYPEMPRAAMEASEMEFVLSPVSIGELLKEPLRISVPRLGGESGCSEE